MNLDDCKTTTEIETYRVEKIIELRVARKDRNTIKQAKLEAQRERIAIQSKIKDLEIAEDKANNIIADLTTEIELAKTKYWQVKD